MLNVFDFISPNFHSFCDIFCQCYDLERKRQTETETERKTEKETERVTDRGRRDRKTEARDRQTDG